jgi:hypothetical protein
MCILCRQEAVRGQSKVFRKFLHTNGSTKVGPPRPQFLPKLRVGAKPKFVLFLEVFNLRHQGAFVISQANTAFASQDKELHGIEHAEMAIL